MPRYLHPIVTYEFPNGSQKGSSLRQAHRLIALTAVLALVAAACSNPSRDRGGENAARRGDAVELEQASSSPRQDVPSALDSMTGPGLPEPRVDPAELISGGPPPDGIPAIDRPRFERASEVDWVADREPVMTLTIEDETRAYPVQVMTWHEIVNDTVAGVPVVVTYCPLCNSALVYEREVDGQVLDFAVSGKLYNSSLVMYDRQTESLWSHFVGDAIAGVMTGTQLEELPVAMVSWADWREANPQGWVLSKETGFDRPYGTNPYVNYDRANTDPALFEGTPDGQMPAKTRVVGIEDSGRSVAILTDTLRTQDVVHLELGSRPLVAWAKSGTASALDSQEIAQGKEVGQTGVFESVLDGQELTFEASGNGFKDRQTQSTWNVLGQAVDGPLSGKRLNAVPHVDTFWFAWAAFQPETQIFDSTAAGREQDG